MSISTFFLKENTMYPIFQTIMKILSQNSFAYVIHSIKNIQGSLNH